MLDYVLVVAMLVAAGVVLLAVGLAGEYWALLLDRIAKPGQSLRAWQKVFVLVVGVLLVIMLIYLLQSRS